MPRRTNVPIELSDESKRLVEEDVARTGISRKELVERLIKWYAAQDEVVRATVLNTIPESVAVDVARIVLERMAKRGGKGKGAA